MRKSFRKLTAVILAVCLVFLAFPLTAVSAAEESAAVAENDNTIKLGDVEAFYENLGNSGNLEVGFTSPYDTEVVLRVKSSYCEKAFMKVVDKNNKLVAESAAQDYQSNFNKIGFAATFEVKKGMAYTIVIPYTNCDNPFFLFELNKIVDIREGTPFEVKTDSVYRYKASKNASLELYSDEGGVSYSGFDSTLLREFDGILVVKPGDVLYLGMYSESRVTLREETRTISAGDSISVRADDSENKAFFFTPAQSDCYRITTDKGEAMCRVCDENGEYVKLRGEMYNEGPKDLSFKAEAGKTYAVTVWSSEPYTLSINYDSPLVIKNGAFYGDLSNSAELKIPSHYNSPYDRNNPDKYTDSSVKGAAEVTAIAYDAFGLRKDLVSVEVPDTVKTISWGSFFGCSNLENADFGDSVEEIGNLAFADCKSIKKVSLPASLKKLGFDAFFRCSSIDTVKLAEGIEKIGSGAFQGCPALTGVTIPASVTEIDENAFGYKNPQAGAWVPEKVEGFTIRGFKGTEAERYANANGFKFVEIQRGDADGDGKVDAADRIRLMRCLAKWKGYEDIDSVTADVNTDGKVDTKDRIILARHIAKWKGYESLPYKG